MTSENKSPVYLLPQRGKFEEDEAFARNLNHAGKVLERMGRPASRLALLDRATRNYKAWPYQKLRLQLNIKAENFEVADEIIKEVDALANVSEQDHNIYAAYRRRVMGKPIDSEWLEPRIAPSGPYKIQPVTNRICYFLHNSLPYSSGGYATRAQGLAKGLSEIGYNVICMTRPGFPADIVNIAKEDVLPVDWVDGIQYHRITEPSRKRMTGQRYVQAAANEIEKQLKELRPEVVIAASNHITSLPPQIAARRLGIPFIYEIRGFWEITRASRDPDFIKTENFRLLEKFESMSASAADHVFTLTRGMQDEITTRGVSPQKVSLLPNSCDPEGFEPSKRDSDLAARLGIPKDVPVIGYIGSFVQYEGLDDLAQACALLKSRGVKFRLLLVGNENTSGQDKGEITKAIEAASVQGNFCDWLVMPGRVPHEEVTNYYSLIDIAPFPRKPQLVTEMVSPMKPLEAMAMKKAVVASSVQALADMVKDGETGLVFEKGNIEALAEVLIRLINDSDLRVRLGEAGRNWVKTERTWLHTARQAQTEINRVLTAHNHQAAVSEISETQ